MPLFDLLMTFHSTHHALLSDRLLEESGVAKDLIPTPRQFSAGCGLSLLLHSTQQEQWYPLLQTRVVWGGIYHLTNGSPWEKS